MLPGAVGKVSVKTALKVAAEALLLPKIIVMVEVPPAPITPGENCLVTVGGVEINISALVDKSLLAPSKVVRLPEGIVLIYVPEILLSTLTLTVQDPLAGIVAPVRIMLVAELAADTKPLAQVVLAFGVCATTNPVGKVSVNEAIVSADALGLVSEIFNTFETPGSALAVPVVKPAGFPVSSVLLAMAL